MTALWRVLAVHAVAVFAPTGVVVLDCDDTVYKKTGRKVEGAGTFRDAVRSTRARVVHARGPQPGDHHPAGHPTLGWLPAGVADQHAGPPQGRTPPRWNWPPT